jgi:hypothetical protein
MGKIEGCQLRNLRLSEPAAGDRFADAAARLGGGREIEFCRRLGQSDVERPEGAVGKKR